MKSRLITIILTGLVAGSMLSSPVLAQDTHTGGKPAAVSGKGTAGHTPAAHGAGRGQKAGRHDRGHRDDHRRHDNHRRHDHRRHDRHDKM